MKMVSTDEIKKLNAAIVAKEKLVLKMQCRHCDRANFAAIPRKRFCWNPVKALIRMLDKRGKLKRCRREIAQKYELLKKNECYFCGEVPADKIKTGALPNKCGNYCRKIAEQLQKAKVEYFVLKYNLCDNKVYCANFCRKLTEEVQDAKLKRDELRFGSV